MAYLLILSLCFFAGCGDDDEPSKGSSEVKGSFKVDGIKGEVKYGYVYYEDSNGCAEYSFFDKNILKYMDADSGEFDQEFTSIFFDYDDDCSEVEDLELTYKVNFYRETGRVYACERNVDSYLNFSVSKRRVKCSSNSIPVIGYHYGYNGEFGTFYASFSVEGIPEDITYLINDYSRGIEVREVTDSKEIKFLKSIREKVKTRINKSQL